jgi:OOP family OmpA-OmpF porin
MPQPAHTNHRAKHRFAARLLHKCARRQPTITAHESGDVPMTLKPLLLGTACALAVTGSAHARGWYVGVEAGASSVADTDAIYREIGPAFTALTEGEFDTGWTVLATVGYALQNWRIEIEAAWRSNDKDRFQFPVFSTGDLDELTAMYNMTYAFPLGQGLDLAVGGGAGLDYAMLDIVNVDDGDLNFAYQGIVQLNYALSPSTELTLGYRYLHVLDPAFEETSGTPDVVINFEDFDKHALTLGVRYTFAP